MKIGIKIGTEHEYSINDQDFNPLPISDKIIERISGSVENEVSFGGIKISKELQKHAIELIPSRPGSPHFSGEQSLQWASEPLQVSELRLQVPGPGDASNAYSGPDYILEPR